MWKAMKVCVSPCLMTTPHIGDEDELVTADHADDETEQPEQAAQAENILFMVLYISQDFTKK